MSNFKLRCSAIGQIMPSPKARIRFTKTQIDWVKKRIIENKYNRKEEIKSDFLTKGIEVEEASLTLASKVLKLGFVQKNTKFFENEYITGTPDIIHNDTVIDIKSSWNLFTFPFFAKEIPNSDYWWQLQGYMALTGLEKAKLVYCLVDTPDFLILNECYRRAKLTGQLPENLEDQIRKEHTFRDIVEAERVKVFEVVKDNEAIKTIKERVKELNILINNIS